MRAASATLAALIPGPWVTGIPHSTAADVSMFSYPAGREVLLGHLVSTASDVMPSHQYWALQSSSFADDLMCSPTVTCLWFSVTPLVIHKDGKELEGVHACSWLSDKLAVLGGADGDSINLARTWNQHGCVPHLDRHRTTSNKSYVPFKVSNNLAGCI